MNKLFFQQGKSKEDDSNLPKTQFYLIRKQLFKNGRNGSCLILYYNQNMESGMTLYSTFAPKVLGRQLHTCNAKRSQQGEVAVTIYEKCLLESSSKQRLYIHFDFDVKYAFQAATSTIIFEKAQESYTYFLSSEAELRLWREILRGRLNQRGFHEQFKPKKKIGKGNFASVYLAEKLEDGKNYAVKAFSKEAAYSEDKGKECLIKQIQIMRNLNHKNCMRLFQVFESDNSLYIVVQLLQGGLLYDKVKSKYKFKQNQVKEVIGSILQGLKEMHTKKIMHRDLKPENLIFRSEGSWNCVIADFGLAQFSDEPQYLFVRCGTPGYVAPEVINIKDMTTKYESICDMFSLGLIFHLLLLGVSAFPGKTYNEVLAQNRASNISFQGQEYKRLDPKALNLLVRMLKKNPHERISAVDAIKHPYFTEGMDQEQENDMVLELNHNSKTCESPLVTSANPLRKLDKSIKKDSCVNFVMGKENVFTGKVDTIAETGSTAGSVGKRFESIASPKVSKFSAKK